MTGNIVPNFREVCLNKLRLLTSTERRPKDIFSLKWKNIASNLTSRLSDAFIGNSFCDVTLVSDDQIPFQAHRYVLSAISPLFQNILLKNTHSHPLIYVRGVYHQELDSILHFVFHGEASVYKSNINRFAQAAKDLQIKKIS